MAMYLGYSKVAPVNAITVPFKKCNMDMSYVIGNVNSSGVLQPATGQSFIADPEILDLSNNCLKAAFKYNPQIVSVNFNNLQHISGTSALYDFCNYAQNITDVSFPNLKDITGATAMYYAFYYSNKIVTVNFDSLEKIKATSGVMQGAFYNNTKLQKANFPKLKLISTTSLSSGQDSKMFYQTFYYNSVLEEAYMPNLQYIIGGKAMNYAFYNCPKLKQIFPRLEATVGDAPLYQMFYSATFPDNRMAAFPAFVGGKTNTTTLSSENYVSFAKCFQSAKINGPVFFEMLGDYSTQAQPLFGTKSGSSNYGYAFTSATNVTEFHFNAAWHKTYAFCVGDDTRWGAGVAKPIYFDIAERIIVNGKRYFRDEYNSIYDSNHKKIYTAWRRASIKINNTDYFFNARWLFVRGAVSDTPVNYGWISESKIESNKYSSAWMAADYYTPMRDPKTTDKATTSISGTTYSTAITDVKDEIVYTPFNATTYHEAELPMYAWTGSDGNTYYTFIPEENLNNLSSSSYFAFYKRSNYGYYWRWYQANSTTGSEIYFNSYDSNTHTATLKLGYTDIVTLTRNSSADITTTTPVYSDQGITQIGTVEQINI